MQFVADKTGLLFNSLSKANPRRTAPVFGKPQGGPAFWRGIYNPIGVDCTHDQFKAF